MPIKERLLPASNQWEVEATGEDIPKLAGMLDKTAREGYRKKYHENEKIGFEQVTDPSGVPTYVRKDQVEECLAQGYGKVGLKPTFTMPQLPWARKHTGPGKHKYKYDKASNSIVEVK